MLKLLIQQILNLSLLCAIYYRYQDTERYTHIRWHVVGRSGPENPAHEPNIVDPTEQKHSSFILK